MITTLLLLAMMGQPSGDIEQWHPIECMVPIDKQDGKSDLLHPITIEQWIEYSDSCYADSMEISPSDSITIRGKKYFLFYNNGWDVGRYSNIPYDWHHRKPDFTGFMEWLQRRVK